MAQVDSHLSTGLPGLDRVLKGLIPGDNIVWQVEAVEDYRPFVEPYCRWAREAGQPLQVQRSEAVTEPPAHLTPDDRLLQARGAVIGQSRVTRRRCRCLDCGQGRIGEEYAQCPR